MERPVQFFQFTDLHIRSYDEDEKAIHSTYNRAMRALDAARNLNLDVDFVLFTGDLSDHGSAESYVRLQKLIQHAEDLLAAPVLITPGNHDDRANFQTYLLNQSAKKHHPHYFAREFQDLKVIILDSKLETAYVEGGFEGDQLSWLAEELAKNPEQPILLVFHHPLPPLYYDASDQFLLGSQDSSRLLEIIKPYNVLAILTGHVHAPIVNIVQNVPCISTVATAFRSDHDNDDICYSDASGFNFGTYFQGSLNMRTIMLPSSNQEMRRIPLRKIIAMVAEQID